SAIRRVFAITDRTWRGVGSIPDSGLMLAPEYVDYDAATRFNVGVIVTAEHPACIAGDILRGVKVPTDCTAYATLCTPRVPLGAPMVSSEGTCAAFYNAGRGRPLLCAVEPGSSR
ncbi:MAG TPA: hypothetical protein VIJ11_09055, partial [Galbitalea sp.]